MGADPTVEPIVPRASSGWYPAVPSIIAGSGLGLLVSQLDNYTLSPISEERVSEAAGVNSACGSFGRSLGLAFAGAIMLATRSFAFTQMAGSSAVLAPAEQQQVASALEHDAEIMSNTALAEHLVGRPADAQAEILRINTDARHRAMQVARLIPRIARAHRVDQRDADDGPSGSRAQPRGGRHGPGLMWRGRRAPVWPSPVGVGDQVVSMTR